MSGPRHVHFVAIGGTGMGSLAGLVKARGIRVTGSDEEIYPPMSTALEEWGIAVSLGFSAENLTEGPMGPPDWVVIGNAVRPDNPEARAAIDGGYVYRSFPDALYELALAAKHRVVVSGTHGKTTTTSLVASLLRAADCDPSLLVGGISLDFGGSFHEGSGPHFVVEGDEYDTAFFDKTPKFLHYHPNTLVLTSIEFDHADIYRDLDHVRQAFRELVSTLHPEAILVACFDNADVRAVASEAPCRTVSYALDASSDASWRALAIQAGAEATEFQIEGPPGRVAARLPLHGDFNVANALAAVAAAVELGVPLEDAAAALEGFQGVKRRQELRAEVSGISIFDDFAHHPTAVAGSVAALRSRYPGRRLVAVFEPRTNTSRRSVFQTPYCDALAGADVVVLPRVEKAPIYSATGEVTEFLAVDDLVRDLESRGVVASAQDDVEAIVDFLAGSCREGDVILIMSNGAFGNIWKRLEDALAR